MLSHKKHKKEKVISVDSQTLRSFCSNWFAHQGNHYSTLVMASSDGRMQNSSIIKKY